MNLDPYIHFTFRGTRFEGGRVPIALLGDLAALQDVLVEVARDVYRTAQPERSRFPRGYLKTTSLWLSAIEEGSAVLVLERLPSASLDEDQMIDPFDSARDIVLDAIASVARGEPAFGGIPKRSRQRFKHIGGHLEMGEAIELSAPNPGATPVVYDRAVRDLLIEEDEPTSDDHFMIGPVVAVELDQSSFRVKQARRASDVHFTDDLDHMVRMSMVDQPRSGRYLEGAIPFRIDGSGSFDRGGLAGFLADEITPVSFIDAEFGQVVDRVASLLSMPEGWLDGDGQTIGDKLGERFLQVAVGLADQGLPAPYVYPTPDGGLRAEWSNESGGIELMWEIEADGTHYVHRLDLTTGEDQDATYEASYDPLDLAEHLAQLYAAGPTD
jgi:hypothetical protein